MNKAALLFALLALFAAPVLHAQEPETPPVDPGELLRQIQRNMEAVQKGLDELATEDAAAAGKRTVEDINRLVEELKNNGAAVTKDIDEIIKQMKSSGGGGGGGGGQSGGKGGQPRDSGKERGGAKDRNKPDQGGKGENGKKPESGQKEENGGKNPQNGQNQNGPGRPEDPRERFQQELLEGRWGVLPPELRQRLIERNFREFTPEYQEELRAYFRRLAR